MIRSKFIAALLVVLLPLLLSLPARSEPTFIRGDANQDRRVDLSDPIRTLGFLFRGDVVGCRDAVDANDDGDLDVSDPVWTINYLFQGGAEPPAPYPLCGTDPTQDGNGCIEASACPPISRSVEIFGRVKNTRGEPIGEASIRVLGFPGDEELLTDDGGGFSVSIDPGAADRLQVAVGAPGHASGHAVVRLIEGQSRYTVAVTLLDIDASVVDEDPSDGAELAVVGPDGERARLVIPPGAIPSSSPVRIDLTTLDPSIDAKSAPGELVAKVAPSEEDPGVSEAYLESLGMIEVRIVDLESGEEIHALEAPARIEQRLPEILEGRYVAGDTVPLWHFDVELGLWVEEGAGSVRLGEDGKLWLGGAVRHFSWWNWDALYDKACVTITFDVPADFGVWFGVQGVTYPGQYPGMGLSNSPARYKLLVQRSDGATAMSRIIAVVSGEEWYLEELRPRVFGLTRSVDDAFEFPSPTRPDVGGPYSSPDTTPCDDLGVFRLDVTLPPFAALSGSNRRQCLGATSEAILELATERATTVVWSAPDGGTIQSSDETGALFLPPDALGTYRVVAVVSDEFEESTSTEIRVRVLDCVSIGAPFQRGDSNSDGQITLQDGILVFQALGARIADPTAPNVCETVVIDPAREDLSIIACLDAADANDDGDITCEDGKAILDFLFLGGATLPAPFGACGFDPTPDKLGCENPDESAHCTDE
jgi:hypothetical protein